MLSRYGVGGLQVEDGVPGSYALGGEHVFADRFQKRSSFAFTMMSLDEERCLGCVYIYPSETADADIFMWVRKEEYEELDTDLFANVRRWIAEQWPFETVRYPGREM